MIRILCPEPPSSFSGGARKLWDWGDILNDHGLNASVDLALLRPDLEVDSEPGDLLVVPEVYGDLLHTLAPGVARISACQNSHLAWANVRDLTAHPYTTTPSLRAVLVVSEHNRRMLEFAFPGVRIERFYTSVGSPERFYCGAFPRPKQIAFFGRKKGDRARLVIAQLASRGCLDGWELLQMDGMSDELVGQCLRTSAIFLSFSDLEGFGSPPVEAMACGASVIGFAGQAGAEYMSNAYATMVEDDDVAGFAQAVATTIEALEANPMCQARRCRDASGWVLSTYSREREVGHIVDLFSSLQEGHRP